MPGVFLSTGGDGPPVKYLRLRAEPDPAVAPRAFGLVADSPYVAETRLRDWNAFGGRVTGLATVRGDGARLAGELEDEPPVAFVHEARVGPERHALLVGVRVDATAFVRRVVGSLTAPRVIVDKPIVYRDGAVHLQLVGPNEALGEAVAGLPEAVDVTVRAVGTYHPEAGRAVESLSERQREAVGAALSLGYYEHPRRATHADVADRLGCAPSTAGEHLRRAEAKLVRAAARNA